MVKISPSLMCMDISKFEEQINCLNQHRGLLSYRYYGWALRQQHDLVSVVR
jgi:hypothetical protein